METNYKKHRTYEIMQGLHGDPLKHLAELKQLNPCTTDKRLYIDADGLIYYVAYAPTYKPFDAIEGSFVGEVAKTHFKAYREHFLEMVQDVVNECHLASYRGELPLFDGFTLVFTPSRNFRYDIFPEYKKSRVNKPQSNNLIRLKRYAKRNGLVPNNIEADDYVYYQAMRGNPVASGDKDVVYSVPAAYFYHAKHKEVVINDKASRDRFVLLQTLAGDSSDDIPGIKGVALKTADKLLPEGGTMSDVIDIYLSKGYTKEDAILTRRLVGLDQFNGRRVKLYKGE